MNARQKCKQLKKELDFYKKKPIQANIVQTVWPVVCLQAATLIKADDLRIPGAREHAIFSNSRKLMSDIEPYMEISELSVSNLDSVAITSKLWVANYR